MRNARVRASAGPPACGCATQARLAPILGSHLEALVVKVDVGQGGECGRMQHGVDFSGHLHAWKGKRSRVGAGADGSAGWLGRGEATCTLIAECGHIHGKMAGMARAQPEGSTAGRAAPHPAAPQSAPSSPGPCSCRSAGPVGGVQWMVCSG